LTCHCELCAIGPSVRSNQSAGSCKRRSSAERMSLHRPCAVAKKAAISAAKCPSLSRSKMTPLEKTMPSRQTLYWERAPAACRPLAPAESASGRMGNAWLPFLASSSPAAAAEKPRACEAACVSETNSDAQPDVSSDDMQSSIALASRGPRSSAPLRPPPSLMHGALHACGPRGPRDLRKRCFKPTLRRFPSSTRVVFPSSPRPSEVPSWALGALSTCT